MGLDINLKYCKNWEAALAGEKAHNAATEAERIWHMTEVARDARLAKLSEMHGTDKLGSSISIQEVTTPESKINAGHLCGLGYLRSSYNEAGFNRVAKQRGGLSFYDIFGVGDDHDYNIAVDWAASLVRVNHCIEALQAYESGDLGGYYPIEISAGSELLPPTCADGKEALQVFAEQLKGKSAFTSYSNRAGLFFLDGVQIHGFIPGKPSRFDKAVVFAIAKREDAGEPDFYLQAAQITREMVEHVLAQPDPQNYRLSWSA